MNMDEALEAAERDRGLERDLQDLQNRSERRAWRMAWAAITIALAAVVAVAGLTPLKEPAEMYVVRVDNAKGSIEHVSRLGVAEADYGERLARFDLNRYILACEGYDWYTIQAKYDTCVLLSAPGGPREAYEKRYDDKNPESPVTRLKDSALIHVEVHSITFAAPATGLNTDAARQATIRFTRTERSTTGGTGKAPEHLIATLAYYYNNAEMSEAAARINPLGFQVLRYQVDVDLSRR